MGKRNQNVATWNAQYIKWDSLVVTSFLSPTFLDIFRNREGHIFETFYP